MRLIDRDRILVSYVVVMGTCRCPGRMDTEMLAASALRFRTSLVATFLCEFQPLWFSEEALQ
jgi:hypothetical protein